MFDWLTKPYIQWNFIDSIIYSVELLLLIAIVFSVICMIINIKEKINNSKKDKKK